ncbi:hypothetical protein DUU06_25615 [Salmonella enterica subsp. enterica serovar Enteritidis]|uniref:Uncharacterized protein n=1 Tax=Salmonella enteritidis TaxID=149539 RepID=A0A5V0BEJ9_SALEN|nr:hypothetical protein [Salmonella enterica subsp. enterica serovar Enteritidis]
MFKKFNFIDIYLLYVRQIDTSSEYVHIFLFFKHIQLLHVLVLVENENHHRRCRWHGVTKKQPSFSHRSSQPADSVMK